METSEAATPGASAPSELIEDAGRRERIERRAWLLHLPIYPVLVAGLVYPTVTGHVRFAHDPLEGPDAVLRTVVAVAFVLLGGVIAVLRGEGPPAYDGLGVRERRLVDAALREGMPPSDAVLRQITLERAVEATRRSRRRTRQLTAAAILAVATCVCTTTWWAAVLWLLPVAVVLVHHRRSARLGRIGEAYLLAQGEAMRQGPPMVAVNTHPLSNRAEALALAEPFRDVRHTPRQAELTQELARELHPRHALRGRRWVVIAESSEADDVVAVSGNEVVVVHLTWREETYPSSPAWSRAGTMPRDNASHEESA